MIDQHTSILALFPDQDIKEHAYYDHRNYGSLYIRLKKVNSFLVNVWIFVPVLIGSLPVGYPDYRIDYSAQIEAHANQPGFGA